jgi:alkyl sulfatase BDS1-like metallo-beta-lactamase superfamily hydrolase
VAPGIHPLRGFDLANMTLIDGESGWIVVDPLSATEAARDHWTEGEEVDATLEITRGMFVDLIICNVGLRETLSSDDIALSGSRIDALRFFRLCSIPDRDFPIVTP